jgi:hypothetical protein
MNAGTTTQVPKRGLLSCVVLVFLLAGLAGSAHAEDSLAPDLDAKYRSSLKEALAEYDASHFEEARILFRRAHEINPNARTLRSIGMASFELRDYVAAVRTLSAALVDPRKPLNAEQRAHVQGLLEKSRMYVDIYSLKIAPADARVLIDGRALDAEPDGTVLLGFGSHNLEASKPGYVVRTLPLNVRGGERKELAMTLEKKSLATVQTALPRAGQALGASSSDKAVLPAQEGGRSGAAWFIAAGGTALVSAGAGGLWLFQNKELSSCHSPPDGQRCNNESAVTGRRNLAVGATLATGAAAVTLAVIGFLSRDSSPADPSARSALSCTVLPSGFLCTRPF